MKRTVKSLLDERDREIWSVGPVATVYQALQALAEHDIGAIIVMEDDHLVGIVSERDYARKVILAQRSSRETLVRDIMTADPQTVSADHTVEDCVKIMSDGGFRHLPVVDEGTVTGVVSMLDVVHAIVQNQASLIGDLERYISG